MVEQTPLDSNPRLNISSPAAEALGTSFDEPADHAKAHSMGFEPDAAGFGDANEPIDLDDEARCGREQLRLVEQQFTAYFLAKIGPSRQTEAIRQGVLTTLEQVLASKYGESSAA